MDLISRQDAIDLLLDRGMITSAIYVECMPSAEKKGEWIDRVEHDDHYVYCSICGDEYIENDLRLDSWVKQYFHYCPNCGARMGDEDEQV